MKRQHNEMVHKLYFSLVSLNRIAWILKINRKTVVRKLLFLSEQARLRQEAYLLTRKDRKFTSLQFDELETAERSKLLPLSVPLVIEAGTRKILGYRVCSMPPKGRLAEKSRKKYGFRIDDRSQAIGDLFSSLKPFIHPNVSILSDRNPRYPNLVKKHFPQATHQTTPGMRGATTGQGEQKSGGFDPLYGLNHTCAMLRANINRLIRRTWCTTKRPDRLDAHFALYIDFHNRVVTQA